MSSKSQDPGPDEVERQRKSQIIQFKLISMFKTKLHRIKKHGLDEIFDRRALKRPI